MTEATRESGPIAILVVHGIGAQEPGESAGRLLAGLARLEPGLASSELGSVITIGGQPVRLYEVYWADLLKDHSTRGAFRMTELQSLSWFPWFNHRRGAYRHERYSLVTLAWWWTALPLINVLLLFAYYGAGFLAQLVSGTDGPPRGKDQDKRWWRAAKQAAERSARLTTVDRILDEYVGDVFSYVNSAGRAFGRDDPETAVAAPIEHAYARIVQRFYEQLVKAQADGCAEIHVVAHSLGTVVTYHAMSGLRFEADRRTDADAIRAAAATIRHVYTIGSPLEKIRFFWPALFPGGPSLCGTRVPWDNFVSWFDPVAGTLRRFGDWGAVSNHRLLGGGFFRGHLVYEHSPVFLAAVTRGLCGRELQAQRTRVEQWRDGLVLVGETLLAPTALVLTLAAGMALFLLTALTPAYLLSLVLRQFLQDDTWIFIENATALVFLGSMALALTLAPVIRASRVHRRYWAGPPS